MDNIPEYDSLKTSHQRITWCFNDTILSPVHQQNETANGPGSPRQVKIRTSLGVATVISTPPTYQVEFEGDLPTVEIAKESLYASASDIEKEVVDKVLGLLSA